MKINRLRKNPLIPRLSSPLFLAVKVVCFLAAAQVGAVAQQLFQKPVSLAVKGVPVPTALEQLAKQNDVKLAYSGHFFAQNKKVTLRAKRRPVGEVLETLLKGTGVGFKEIGGQIVLYQLPMEVIEEMTLSGFVEDAQTGERLIAATVFCPELGLGTITNDYGFYSLTLPARAQSLRFSYIGYTEQTVALAQNASQRINQAIEPALMLSEVIVTPADTALGNLLPSPGSMQRFKPEDFKAAPDLGGQGDLLRVMQLLPGVQTGADGTGGMFVRGGNPDQNLVLMDGVPVYNADHLMGMFSIFNPSAIRSAKLLKGGMPARYGGRVSSVVDVYTKEGNQVKWGGEVAGDFIGYKATLEGPMWRKKGSMMFSRRRSHSDIYLLPAIKKLMDAESFDGIEYYFNDINLKLNYAFSENDKFYVSLYHGRDGFSGQEKTEDLTGSTEEFEYTIKWGNTIASLRWNHVFGPKLFANASVTYSKYRFQMGQLSQFRYTFDDPELEPFSGSFYLGLKSKNRDKAWKTDFDYMPNANHYVRFGVSLTEHRFTPSAFSGSQTYEGIEFVDSLTLDDIFGFQEAPEKTATSLDAYVEDEWRLGPKTSASTGLRLSSFRTGEADFFNPEPRISATHALNSRYKATASLTRTVQYLHRINFLGLNSPGDYWTPASRRLRPQRAWQGTLGLEGQLAKGVAFSVEAYYKLMSGLPTLPDTFDFEVELELEDPEAYLAPAKGRSRGIEVLLRRESGRLGGWLGYSLSKSTRQSGQINLGRAYPYLFDRRHEAKLFGFYRFNDQWQASLNWTYGSPNPKLLDSGTGLPTPPGQANSLRGEAYHRLDLALSFFLKRGKWEHHLKLSAFNAYNRRNTAFYKLWIDENFNYQYQPVHLFGFMPGLFYGVRF